MFSPVFQKEMISLSRRRGIYWLRGVVLLFLLGLMGLFWEEAVNQAGGPQISQLGPQLFSLFVKAQLAILYFVIPCTVASVVAGERERGTLELLLLSRLRPGSILIDKLLSRFMVLGLLLFSGLPFFMALLSFRGIEQAHIWRAYGGMTASALYCAALSLFFSTLMPTMRSALMGIYLSLFAFLSFFCLLSGYLTGNWQDVYLSLNNLLLMDAADAGPWAYFCGFSIPCFIASLIRCVERLTEGSPNFDGRILQRQFQRLNRFFHRINFTTIVLLHERAPLGKYPILWREVHKRFPATSIFLIRSFYLLCALLLLLFAFFWPMKDYAASRISSLHLLLTATLAIVYASSAFTHEKENHTFELILSTPISGTEIILGKLAGVLKALTVISLLPLVMPLAADLSELEGCYRPHALLYYGSWLGAYIPLITATGFFFSIWSKSSLRAFVETAVGCCIWYFAPALLYLFSGHQVSSYAYEPIVGVSPIFWLGNPHPLLTAGGIFLLGSLLLVMLAQHFDRLTGK